MLSSLMKVIVSGHYKWLTCLNELLCNFLLYTIDKSTGIIWMILFLVIIKDFDWLKMQKEISKWSPVTWSGFMLNSYHTRLQCCLKHKDLDVKLHVPFSGNQFGMHCLCSSCLFHDSSSVTFSYILWNLNPRLYRISSIVRYNVLPTIDQ